MEKWDSKEEWSDEDDEAYITRQILKNFIYRILYELIHLWVSPINSNFYADITEIKLLLNVFRTFYFCTYQAHQTFHTCHLKKSQSWSTMGEKCALSVDI